MRMKIAAAIVFLFLSFTSVEAFAIWEDSPSNPAKATPYTVSEHYTLHDEGQWVPEGALAREGTITTLVHVHEVILENETSFTPRFESLHLECSEGAMQGSDDYIDLTHEIEALPADNHYRITTSLTLDPPRNEAAIQAINRAESLNYDFTLDLE